MIQWLLNVSLTGTTFFVSGLSFSLCYRSTRVFHIALAGIFLFSAYAAIEFVAICGAPLLIAILGSLLLTGALGALIHRLFYWPPLARGVSEGRLFLISLGVLLIMQNFYGIIVGDAVLRLRTPFDGIVLNVAEGRVSSVRLIATVILGVVATIVAFAVRKSASGVVIRAVSENVEVARGFGLNVLRTQSLCMIAGSMLAGMCGLLSALDVGVAPTLGLPWIINGVVVSGLSRGVATFDHLLWAALLSATQSLIGGTLGWRWPEPLSLALLVVVALLLRQSRR